MVCGRKQRARFWKSRILACLFRYVSAARRQLKEDLENKKPLETERRTKLQTHQPSTTMLYTIALILIIAWLLGLVSSYTIGGLIHILLVVAIIMVLVRLIQGNKV